MFEFVNKELFDIHDTEKKSPLFPNMRMFNIRTPMESNGKRNIDKNPSKPHYKHLWNLFTYDEGYNELETYHRLIVDYVKGYGDKLNINVSITQGENPRVSKDEKSEGRTRKPSSNLIAIAFPFNGFLHPIESSNAYRIYKGQIVDTVAPFKYQGYTYKKILYLLIEPNVALFKPEHRHHRDVISINLESSFIYTNNHRNESSIKTDAMTVTITEGLNIGIGVSCNTREVTEEDIERRDALFNTKPWVTFMFNTDKKSQTISTPDSNMRVSVNRHGIRKEEQIRAYHGFYFKKDNSSSNYGRNTNRQDYDHNRDRRGKDKHTDIDQMIQDSHLISAKEYRASRGSKKKRKNNRRKG